MTLEDMQNYFRSSSTYSTSTTVAWLVSLAYGATNNGLGKATNAYISCVR